MSVAIITGASAGIGAALARELHARGWSVGLVARRGDVLEKLAATLGERVAWATADVTDLEQTRAAFASLEQRLGPCDVMVANAGVGVPASATRLDALEASWSMRTNIDGVLFSVAAVLPGMLERGRGHLVAVSSPAGWRGLPRSGPYSASKAAVSTLMESFRLELRPRGIKVSTVNPGFVATEMTAKNRFSMPLLMSSERAATLVANGIERASTEINFPWPTILFMRMVRLLPNFLYDWLAYKARP